jgi:hypothetical protein
MGLASDCIGILTFGRQFAFEMHSVGTFESIVQLDKCYEVLPPNGCDYLARTAISA